MVLERLSWGFFGMVDGQQVLRTDSPGTEFEQVPEAGGSLL